MVLLSADTSPDIENLQIERLRQRYPHDTPELRQRRLADLLLGPDLARRVYGELPEEG